MPNLRGFQQPQKPIESGIIVPPRLDEGEAQVSSPIHEQEAYLKLVELGGRPSHPIETLKTVIRDAGEYRDIIGYWQEDPAEWQLFTVQLAQWQQFLDWRNAQCDQFGINSYLLGLKSRLSRSGFDFTPYMAHLNSCLEGAEKRDAVATWIEYFDYQFSLRENWQMEVDSLKEAWDRQWQKLANSGVLTAEEVQENNGFSFYDRSCAEITLESQQHRSAYEKFEQQHEALRHHKRGSARTSAEKALVQAEQKKRAHLKEVADELGRRHELIRRFIVNTSDYRRVVKLATTHNVLLKWILQQLPVIAEQDNSTAKDAAFAQRLDPNFNRFVPPFAGVEEHVISDMNIKDCSDKLEEKNSEDTQQQNEQPASFTRFMKLPQELRRDIWLKCLPPQPTAHFFSIVNHSRPWHLKHRWNTQEFRVQPTTQYESGYSAVYPLISSCREAREVIWTYYKFLRQRQTEGRLEPESNQVTDFQSFEWIPPNDLIVLCFPPVERKLLGQHSLTFEYSPAKSSRHVAVLVSKEMLEAEAYGTLYDFLRSLGIAADDEQLVGVAEIFEALYNRKNAGYGGGQSRVGGLYICAEDWRAVNCFLENNDSTPSYSKLTKGLYEVRPGSCNRRIEAEPLMNVARSRHAVRPVHRDWDDNAGGSDRHIWWLGAGKKGLALMEPPGLGRAFFL